MQLPASGEGALARINLIYVGPLDAQHHVSALADAFLTAHDHDPRLHLLVVGEGGECDCLQAQLGHTATFLGTLPQAQLDELVARADLLVCPTTSADTAPTIIEAQKSGLPVLAVEGGDAAALIENGRSGFLVPDDRAAFAGAIRWLSRRATLRERLATGGLLAAGARHTSGQGRIMSV
ncbi:MAG TPA: glycosyltransferase [Solirubrobacteraceae bacterium]|jgi:glycosyltransferase involved in cell wall biosynthesis|nr:glycosyltransferase [Solirubrobacteraceae bacterium]